MPLFLTFLIQVIFCYSFTINSNNNNEIQDFSIKVSEDNSKMLAVYALDTANNTQINLHGRKEFSINGLSQFLEFKQGESKLYNPLKSSGFFYVKHSNEFYQPAHLYYVLNSFDIINFIEIDLVWLLAIPIGLFLLGYLFRKLLLLAIVLFIAYMYFNYAGGLKFSTILEYILSLFQSFI